MRIYNKCKRKENKSKKKRRYTFQNQDFFPSEGSQRNHTFIRRKEADDSAVEDENSDVENDKPPKESLYLGIKKKQASIDYYSYDFDKIIKGERANKLTKYLASLSHSSPLFENQTIQAYIET